MSKGIDYGMGQTNIDKANGIRFGVISQHSLGEYALEEFEADYGDPSCPECGGTVIDSGDELAPRKACKDYYCKACKASYYSDACFGDEPIGHYLDTTEYKAQLDSHGDVFILKSPYFTRAQFCSPCAPGACHLDNPMEDGERAYCFGHDWFKGDKAPYPVYSVATGELVNPS